MAKAKVKVGIYKKARSSFGYGYSDNPEVISEEKFEELVADRMEELRFDYKEFADYLADYYTYEELFDMDENEKAKVRKEYEQGWVERAREDVKADWDYYEIETEVEIPCNCHCHCPSRK